MSDLRYYVVEVVGWSAISPTSRSSQQDAISLSILDRHTAHREVWRDYAGTGGTSRSWRRREAWAECERLNSLPEAE